MGELRGIHIDTRTPPFPKEEISSVAGSLANNNSDLPRKRTLSPDGDCSQLDDYEMEKIRSFMANMDGRSEGGSIGSQRGSIEPSLMSTVFAVVLVLIISISVYAFASLFKAVMKRMNP